MRTIQDEERYWVIFRKHDNAIMPLNETSHGFGSFSKTEFDTFCKSLPRLFISEASARAALTAWCQGKWTCADECCPEVIPFTSRDRTMYGIRLVKISLL